MALNREQIRAGSAAGDPVLSAFLENTKLEAIALVARSDVLTIVPLGPGALSSGYVCEFSLPYLRRLPNGTVEVAPGPVLIGVRFPEDYLRSADPHLYVKVASVITPDLIHPNISGGMVCLGASFSPGTSLTALLWELYDIVSYQNVTLDERNALNPEACRLLREHQQLLEPLRPAPFLRRERTLQATVKEL